MNENIVQLFNNAKSVVIVVGKSAKLDGVAAALALYLALMKEGKSAKICSEANLPDAQKLIGSDKISHKLEEGGNTLKISFPYSDGNIDKVTYNITDDRFNLLIEPRAGNNPLKNSDVQYNYTGAQLDLIVTVDAPSLESLGNIYLENPDQFVREKIVNIDRRFDNQQYGVQNLVEKQFSSTSEIIAKLLDTLRWDLNPDIATNLYAGLVSATNNFTSFSTNAQSFETASYLLKNSARKIAFTPPARQSVNQNQFGQRLPSSSRFSGAINPNKQEPENKDQKPTPQDWLKPKIFKSTDLV